MNKTVVINEVRYEYVNEVTDLNTHATAVLCKDEHGCFFTCDKELWQSSTERNILNSESKFNKYATPEEKIALFRSLFVGREDVYAKRYENQNTGRSGYVPACGNEWVQGVCDKKKHKCTECPNRSFLKLSNQVLYHHLSGKDELGRDVIGTYPMLQDETTKFLVIDFDEANWQSDVNAVRITCNQYEISTYVERSRSGNGAHLWIFFTEPVKASLARKLGSAVLTKTMEDHPSLKFISYDRMFPNQDTMPKGGFGNLIALPLQGKARKDGNSEFVDERFISYPDQWEYLYRIKRLSPEQLNSLLHQLCKGSEMGELLTEADEKPWEKLTEKPLAPLDFTDTIRIIRANMLYINKSGLSNRSQNKIKRLAAFKNPEFYRKQAMRLSVTLIPRVIYTSEDTEQYIAIPRGCEESLIQLLNESNADYMITDRRNTGKTISVRFNGTLRPEQQTAANEMLRHDIGILSATTAFGKTVVASYLISERKVNTLILVHSSALLQQWKKSLSEFLLFDDPLTEQPKSRGRRKELSHIGQLGSAKNTINDFVDIAIMQSLVSGDRVKELVKNYGMVIVDECHHVSAFTFERILREVNAKYVYGLTATPTRQDGHHPIIYMQCGPIRYRVGAKEQIIKSKMGHYVTPVFTDFRIAETDLKYPELCGRLCADEARNIRIARDVVKAYEGGRNPIVLTERKEHAEMLCSQIAPSCNNFFVLSGNDKAKDKRKKLEAIKTVPVDENLVIIATGKYVGEGFDEPRLDTLFLAMLISWEGTLAQYAGRLHRNYTGKTEVRIYDYADIFVPTFERSYLRRVKGYAKLGYMMLGSDESEQNIIYNSQNYMERFGDDIRTSVREIVISSPRVKPVLLERLLNMIPDSVQLAVVTRASEKEALINFSAAKCKIRYEENLKQTFTVIDNRIVWYGEISPLYYASKESAVLRFVNASVAGELKNNVLREAEGELRLYLN